MRPCLLASGGGMADRCIRFWNTITNTNTALRCVDTGSQVCNLVWSKNVNELVSTHGYSRYSPNQIIVWRYPTMSKLATLTGHTQRVLYLAGAYTPRLLPAQLEPCLTHKHTLHPLNTN